ncbi:MAG: glycosyltransferase family 2 protein [Acidobacteriota bacterium]|nr:glycosyltransferase family 2 protein [Acidobacteriota bacterium]
MYEGKTVGVVVPAHNEELLIGRTIETMPDYVDKIIVVNDKSDDRTAEVVRGYVARLPDRVVLIDLAENQGVGGSIAAGYRWARDHELEMTAVMAGDAQMDPDDLPALLDPIVQDKSDYTKGNRLFYGRAWHMIPKVRYLGNSGLSLLTKIVSGYWHIADSQAGYTVASLRTLKTLDLDKIFKRYGMPNDMLVKLNVYDFRVRDVYVKPVYNIGEKSGIRIGKVFFTIPMLLLRLFFYRMIQKYVIRDFHPLILFYFFGATLLFLDGLLVIRLIVLWIAFGSVPPITALAILFCSTLGFQSLLFAMLFDMEANKDLKGD